MITLVFRLLGTVQGQYQAIAPDEVHEATGAMLRFDQEAHFYGELTLRDAGQSTYIMELVKVTTLNGDSVRDDAWFRGHFLAAHWLLLRYTLTGGYQPTVQFSLAPRSVAVKRVFEACHLPDPKPTSDLEPGSIPGDRRTSWLLCRRESREGQRAGERCVRGGVAHQQPVRALVRSPVVSAHIVVRE